MILNYKTDKFPFNFVVLGCVFFVVGFRRMVFLERKGILFFSMSLLFFFLESGMIIDTDNKRVKKYIGCFAFRKGKWEDIGSLTNLQIIKTRVIRNMSVLSISRTHTSYVYKLFMTLPDRNIELISGKRNYITKQAKKISTLLQTLVIN